MIDGTVQLTGPIAPTSSGDTYPTHDAKYGIDGFRNVDTIDDLNNISTDRRRAGMIVGVSGGTYYYKLNNEPWNGDITDWTEVDLGGSPAGITGSIQINSGGSFASATSLTYDFNSDTLVVHNISGCSSLNILTPININGVMTIGSLSGDTYTLPSSKGLNSQVLQTDENGNVSWQTIISGIDGVIADTQIAFGSGTTLIGSNDLVWNTSNKKLTIKGFNNNGSTTILDLQNSDSNSIVKILDNGTTNWNFGFTHSPIVITSTNYSGINTGLFESRNHLDGSLLAQFGTQNLKGSLRLFENDYGTEQINLGFDNYIIPTIYFGSNKTAPMTSGYAQIGFDSYSGINYGSFKIHLLNTTSRNIAYLGGTKSSGGQFYLTDNIENETVHFGGELSDNSLVYRNWLKGGLKIGGIITNTSLTTQLTLIGAGNLGINNTLEINNSDDISVFAIKDNGSINGPFLTSNEFYTVIRGRNNQSLSANFGIGRDVLFSVTTGYDNFLLGNDSWLLTSGHHNLIIGSGKVITTGYNNFIQGREAGKYISTGYNNFCFGDLAGNPLTTGYNNFLIGDWAGYGLDNTNSSTSFSNIVFGDGLKYCSNVQLYNNISILGGMGNYPLLAYSGRYNIGIGALTLLHAQAGIGNVAIGSSTLEGNSSGFDGSYNIGIGYQTGLNLTTGSYNILQGYDTGHNLTTGSYNILQGYQAGYSLTTGYQNIIQGLLAGYSLTEGAQNILQGASAGYSLTTGNYNILQGSSAGYYLTTGSYNILQGYQAGLSLTTGSHNILQGYQAGLSLTTGSHNIFLGYEAGYSLTEGDYNIALGYYSLYTTIITGNIGIGAYAGANNISGHVTAIGFWAGANNVSGDNLYLGIQAGLNNITGTENTIVGQYAGVTIKGNKNTVIGNRAGYGNFGDSTGDNNTIIGNQTWNSLTTGYNNTLIGSQSGRYISSGFNNIGIGLWALNGSAAMLTGNDNIGIGYQVGFTLTTGSYNILQGYQVGYYLTEGAHNILQGYQAGFTLSTGAHNILQGYQAGYSLTEGAQNILQGASAGYFLTTGNYNILQGYRAGYFLTTGSYNIGIGYQAGYSLSTGSFNILQGTYAGLSLTTGNYNILNGYYAGSSISTGEHNVGIGLYSLGTNITTGLYNVAIGNYAGGAVSINSSYNTLLGAHAGNNLTGDNNTLIGYAAGGGSATIHLGSSNTFIGYNAGINSTGSSNVFLGYQAGYNETGSNMLYISNSNTSTPLIFGDFSTNHIKFNADVEVQSTQAYHLGDKDTDGTWRFIRSGNNLEIQRRELGSYVTKSTILA